MTLTKIVTENIIRKLLKGKDYRNEIVNLINAEFLQFTIEFFKKIATAKLNDHDITLEWYKKEFINSSLSITDIAINSGLNKKTIHNMYNSSTKKIVLEASLEHFKTLSAAIQELVETENELDLTLTIKLKGVSVDLNVSESLLVINTLAVKRSELRGGFWSTAGKRVEKPLMETLCKLYSVPKENYFAKAQGKILADGEFEREIDFFLTKDGNEFECEVKLMGRGNPESADAVIARASKVFVADKLSETNKKQLNSRKVEWVQFREDNGFKRFKTVLENLDIPHQKLKPDFEESLNNIFKEIFQK